jgi:hypothetical protein
MPRLLLLRTHPTLCSSTDTATTVHHHLGHQEQPAGFQDLGQATGMQQQQQEEVVVVSSGQQNQEPRQHR